MFFFIRKFMDLMFEILLKVFQILKKILEGNK